MLAKPFAWIFIAFYNITNNYGLTLIFFALLTQCILTPLSIASRKNKEKVKQVQPEVDRILNEVEDPKQREAELEKVYAESGANPLGGYFLNIIPFLFFTGILSIITKPMTYLMDLSTAEIEILKNFLTEKAGLLPASFSGYFQFTAMKYVTEYMDELKSILPNIRPINFDFCGIDLTTTPQWNYLWSGSFTEAKTLLFLLPIFCIALRVVPNLIQIIRSKCTGNQIGSLIAATSINLLLSIFLCFTVPAALEIYWISRSVFQLGSNSILRRLKHRKKIQD